MKRTIQVITTTETKSDAQVIARAVVQKRLAACVQIIGPITSTYWWQGEIETAEEWLCLIKSRQDLYEELEEAIREVHPYDVPEILAVPVLAGSLTNISVNKVTPARLAPNHTFQKSANYAIIGMEVKAGGLVSNPLVNSM